MVVAGGAGVSQAGPPPYASDRVVRVAAGGGPRSTVPVTGLNSPPGPALDGTGNLYLADGFGNRVVRVRETDAGQTTLAPTGLNTTTLRRWNS
ncbi:hypothetical protein ACIRBY_14630 [Streptomyces sp. NPDC096136]|uniref:hypothetical protein n=1 Tax=Streptomyces sp. NPDC096136 TaxID=3366076 RepID=UPI0038255688